MPRSSNSGVITLEACVSVLVFLVLMLFISSLFLMFMAQNSTGHAVLQASQSLSLDAYSTERMQLNTADKDSNGSIAALVRMFVEKLFGNGEDNPCFVTDNFWFATTAEEKDVENAVKSRFIGYYAGGDETKANEMLKQMNVVDGIDGLDFSGSYVKDNVLYVVLRYQVEYSFNIWGLGVVDVEQTACSKLWR